MKRVLTITSDESLTEGLQAATDLSEVEFETAEDWEVAKTRLVDRPYQAVCIDYETVKIEGFNAFVQLDNILQKEGTGAIVLLRDETPRAEEFVTTLDSFERSVDLSKDAVGSFQGALEALLEEHPDPAESQPTRPGRRPTVEVVLPDITGGDLSEHSVARVVHTVRQQEWSGVLTLATDEMQRRFEFAEGGLVESGGEGGSSFGHLEAAFAWSGGEYSFERDESIGGETVEPYPILMNGAQNHLDQRSAMDELTPVMQRYVAATTFLEECREQLAGNDDLEAFVELADGETTLEEILSAVASRVLTGFQAGFLAIECDLVALTEEPSAPTVEVEFSTPETSAERQASGGREGISPASSVHSSHDEPDTRERESELRRTHERLAEASPYEVFDLWEGCGEDAVRDRYFKLVKRHHPDSYGGNISDEAKELAEKIFIRIKRAYSELLRREDEQRVSRAEAVESDTTGQTSLDQSLTSPSVTAMGGGEETARRADADDERETSEPSLETSGPTTEEMAAPAASKRPSTDQVDPEQNEARMRYARPDRESSTSRASEEPDRDEEDEARRAGLGEDPSATEERSEKLRQIRDRLTNKADRAGKKTPIAPNVREQKLESLRENETTERKRRVENLEPPQSQEEAQEYFNLGYRSFKNEDEARAHEFFELAYEFDDEQSLWKTFYAYTLFLRDADQRDRARELLEEVVESDDKQARPDAHLFLGRILKVREEHRRARKHFERAAELDPNSVEAKRELRVYEMRDEKGESSEGDSENFFGKFFDKDLF